MVSLGQFARRMRERGQRLEENANQAVIEMAGTILQTIVQATPVDTGRARGGWQAAVGAAPRGDTGLLDRSGATAVAGGRARLATRRLGQDIFIANNVEYIGFLNQGSSAQAPANFVRQAIIEGVISFRQRRLLQ